MVMKTHFFLMSTVALLGASLLTTGYAASTSEYLHFTRHRDSNGNLLMAPIQHQAEAAAMQKTVMPSQPQMFEQRTTDWGMSVQEVKDNEPVQSSWDLQSPVLADYEQRVAYHTQIEGIEAALTYTFYDNHLGQAKYVFEPQHEDAVEFVQDFHAVKNWITRSYGAPTFVQEIWLDTLYQYDSSLWGQAVKRGHLVVVAEWENPGTDIVLMLDGGDDTVGLVADFSSTTFVVPVSLDTQNWEENVEAALEKSIHSDEAFPAEPAIDPSVEDIPRQDMTHDIEGSGAFHPEGGVASQARDNEIEAFQGIGQMLNKEFPVNEPVTKEFVVTAPVTKEFPLKEVDHEFMDEHFMGEQHLMGEGMMQDPSIEPSVDIQAPENTIDMSGAKPLESSLKDSAIEPHPTNEHAMGEHAMEAEAELDPQHL